MLPPLYIECQFHGQISVYIMRSIDFGWQFNVVQASDLAVYFAGLDPTRWHAAVAAPPDCSVRYLEPRTPAATVAATVCATVDYVVKGGLVYVDPVTGKRTTWGYWDP